MTPDDLKWREARREHMGSAIMAALVAPYARKLVAELDACEEYRLLPQLAAALADKLIDELDRYAKDERAANDAS